MTNELKETISLRDASKKLGIDRETLARWIKSGKCPFGNYVPPAVNTRKGYYYISRYRLDIYINAIDMNNSSIIQRMEKSDGV